MGLLQKLWRKIYVFQFFSAGFVTIMFLVTDKNGDQAPASFIRRGRTLEIMKPSSSAVYEIHVTPKNNG